MAVPSTRLGIPKPAEGDTPDVPRDLGAAVDRIDAIAMSVDVGPLSSRPPSSPSSPGTPGHAFVVTDQTLTGPRLDVDTGTGFFTAGPAPVDAAPGVPSSRTLGTNSNQACAGDDPRLVGGLAATGDIGGTYPGPITVNTWNGQNKAQVVASVPPQVHGSSHLAGGSDPISGITDAQIAAANKDGPAATAGMRTLGTGAQQACAGNDPRLGAPAPIGAVVAYAGTADPPETDWVIADGRLIDRTTYAAFYARVGHAYNGNVDPGGNKVRIPDKRGKKSVGALNMGSAAGAPSPTGFASFATPGTTGDQSRLNAVRGASYGEVNHTLSAAESGTNGSAVTGNDNTDHSHGVNINSAGASARHNHATASTGQLVPASNNWVFAANGASITSGAYPFIYPDRPSTNNVSGTGNDGPDHAHNVSGNTAGRSAYHQHALAARNADNVHNTTDPCEADSYLVRIA